MEFRYFGRHGGTGEILAIYRIQSKLYNNETLDFKHFPSMELFSLPNEAWITGDFDRLEADWMHGWFDGNDEITEQEALFLISKWKNQGWPGQK